MLKRKINDQLIKWKNNLENNRTAMIVKGARQVGKTTSILNFARQNYENVVYINFMEDTNLKKIFDGQLKVNNIINALSFEMNDQQFIPYKTIIIFDEIQECSNARLCFKPFMIDGRYDIIATGSLLGVKGYNKKEIVGSSVGFESFIEMKSLDFEEFLWANGYNNIQIDQLLNYLKNKEKIDDSIHNKMIDLFRKYICVGGMPKIVDEFLKTNDINKVRELQRSIIELYKADFGKHLNKQEKPYVNRLELNKILQVFNSIPVQLARQNNKFVFNQIDKSANYREYVRAIQWLEDYGIISRCYNVSSMENPLQGFVKPNQFKIYLQDTGLLVSLLDKNISKAINNNDPGIYKGYIYENIIADAFKKNGFDLFYFSRTSGLEIDFVISLDLKINLIEVKSSNGNAKSLRTILENKNKYKINHAIKLSNSNIGYANNVLTIPYYLAFLIRD